MTAEKRKEEKREKSDFKRWTATRKKEAVLRLLKGEEIDHLSRELGVSIGQLERWKEAVLSQMELLLKARSKDPLAAELDVAKKRIGELSMEVEILREKGKKQGVFWGGKW